MKAGSSELRKTRKTRKEKAGKALTQRTLRSLLAAESSIRSKPVALWVNFGIYYISLWNSNSIRSKANPTRENMALISQVLWQDPERIEIPARTTDEPRILVVAKIGGNCWSAVVTPRGDKTRNLGAPFAKGGSRAI